MMNGHHLESYFGHECYNEANCVDGRQQYPNLCKYLQVPNVGQCFSVAFSPITTFFLWQIRWIDIERADRRHSS